MTRSWVLVTLAILTASCSPPLAKIFNGLGQTTSRALQLPPGPINFPMEIQGVTFDQARKILLTVEVLRQGKVVKKIVDCRAFTISHHATSGTRSGGQVQHAAECTLTVPAPGADQIRVSTRLDGGTAQVQGMYVHVRKGAGLLGGLFGG